MPALPSPSVVEAILVLLMLLGASWSDILTRRVRNQYWVPFVIVTLILWGGRLDPLPLDWIIGAAVMTVLTYALWYIGTFGGADAKGMMVFAWLWPGSLDILAGRTLPVLDTLVNAALVAVAMPFGFLVWNLARGHIAFPAMLLGTRMARAQAERRFVWPLQRVVDTDDGPALRWRFWQRPAEGLAGVYGRLRVQGIDEVWVTPKIPFMIPLTFGAVVTWQFGNLVLWIMLQA